MSSLDSVYTAIRRFLMEINSPYNEGWTACSCKHELFLLKSWLDDEYQKLPKFDEEISWDKERLVKILKK